MKCERAVVVEFVEMVKTTLLRNLRFSGVLGLSCVGFHFKI